MGDSASMTVSTTFSTTLSFSYSKSDDNFPVSDNHNDLDGGNFGFQGRMLGPGEGGSFGPPALLPLVTPYASHYSAKVPASRSLALGLGWDAQKSSATQIIHHHHHHHHYHPRGGQAPGHATISFRLKGAEHSGIPVSEALNSERLSQENALMMDDITRDTSGHITLKVRRSGYRSITYKVPLSGDFQGRVDVQSLARRTARAIVNFMQSNNIDISWDRVVIKRLEETSPGNWTPLIISY